MKSSLLTSFLLICGFTIPSAFATPLWCQGSDGYWYNVPSTQRAEQLNLTNCSKSHERSSAGLEAMAKDMEMVAVVNSNGSSEIVYNPGIRDAFSYLAKLQKHSENILSDQILSILEIKGTQILQCTKGNSIALTPDDHVWATELAGFSNCQSDLRLGAIEQTALFVLQDGETLEVSATKKSDILREYSNFQTRNQTNEEKLAAKLNPSQSKKLLALSANY
jgi:hypothetical protein